MSIAVPLPSRLQKSADGKNSRPNHAEASPKQPVIAQIWPVSRPAIMRLPMGASLLHNVSDDPFCVTSATLPRLASVETSLLVSLVPCHHVQSLHEEPRDGFSLISGIHRPPASACASSLVRYVSTGPCLMSGQASAN